VVEEEVEEVEERMTLDVCILLSSEKRGLSAKRFQFSFMRAQTNDEGAAPKSVLV
jgi:hypothetical protein